MNIKTLVYNAKTVLKDVHFGSWFQLLVWFIVINYTKTGEKVLHFGIYINF